jgi:hypothetical protein
MTQHVHHNVLGVSVGAAFPLAVADGPLVFGTTSPNIILNSRGVYLFLVNLVIAFTGATMAATQDITVHLQRTNNTPALIPGSSKTIPSGAAVAGTTGPISDMILPFTLYSTPRDDDAISIYASIAALPALGTVDILSATLMAIRQYKNAAL